jgi:hypothetical protein
MAGAEATRLKFAKRPGILKGVRAVLPRAGGFQRQQRLGFLLCLVVVAGRFAQSAQLNLEVVGADGRALWTRVEVRRSDGRMFQPEGAIRDAMNKTRGGGPWYPGSFIVPGTAKLDLPAGAYTIIAEHGLEYERVKKPLSVPEAGVSELRLRLRPWIRMRELGWWSGDMHVHRPLAEAPAIAQAEDLNVTVLVDRDKANLFGAGHWPARPVERVSQACWLTLRNPEDERRGGSWIFNGLKAPFELGPGGAWYPPGLFYIRQVRGQRQTGEVLPWFDVDMPFWWEVPVVMALEPPDSLDILHNQFMLYGIDQSEYWGRARDRDQFPGAAGFVNYCLDLYYRYLNLGFRVPPSAGTGSGVMPNPAGYDRVYARVEGDFTVEKWYETIRDGKSFVSNGPLLFTTTSSDSNGMRVEAVARAREPIDRLELVANGQVIGQVTPRGRVKSLRARFWLEPRKHSWCAVRCFLRMPDNIRLAHSSPIYLPGSWNSRPDAAYFVAWIDELLQQTARDQKRFRNDAERDTVVGVYQQARERYCALMRAPIAKGSSG